MPRHVLSVTATLAPTLAAAPAVALALVALACSSDHTPTMPTTSPTAAPAFSLQGSGKSRPPRSGVVQQRLTTLPPTTPNTSRGNGLEHGHQDGLVVGPNVVTNQDRTFLPQNETVIAVDGTDPQRLVASSNDYRFARTSDSRCGAYASTDGGATWRDLGDGTVPSPLPAAGDPSVAFAPNGDAYWACLGFDRVSGATALYVAKSSDLTSVTTRAPLVQTTNGNDVFHDKPYIAIDRGGSRFRGRIYVTWTHFDITGSPIFISSSSDGGATWTRPTPVTPPELPDNHGSFPGVGPDGEVYVAFENFDTPTLNINQIMVARSNDGGRTFARPVKVDAVFDLCPRIVFNACSLLNTRFRVNSFPALAVDAHDGRVYVTWGDYRSGNADVLASMSDDGKRWSRSVRVNDDRTTTDQFFPAVALTPAGDVTIAYYDRRNDPRNFRMDTYLSISHGGGLAFGRSVRVTSASMDPDVDESFGGGFIGDYNGNAASRLAVHPIWTDTRGLGFPKPNQDAVTASVFLGDEVVASR
jgi:hypothetical protein